MEVDGDGGGAGERGGASVREQAPAAGSASGTGTLKRCSSAPVIAPHPSESAPPGEAATPSVDTNSNNGHGNDDNRMDMSVSMSMAMSINLEQSDSAGEGADCVEPRGRAGSDALRPQCRPLISRETSPFESFLNHDRQRTRRFSASFSPRIQSPNGRCPRLTPRISQLRQEESVDFTNTREVAHERETHSAMQMSQSWEDLTLVCGGGSGNSSGPASPTRTARLSPGVSPSPTRKAFATRRSLSPIAMRPSCLSPVGRLSGLVGMKRRFDLDEPASKRCCWSSDRLTPSTPGTPDSLGEAASGFTFRPVSPRASPLPSPVSASQNHAPQNPS